MKYFPLLLILLALIQLIDACKKEQCYELTTHTELIYTYSNVSRGAYITAIGVPAIKDTTTLYCDITKQEALQLCKSDTLTYSDSTLIITTSIK